MTHRPQVYKDWLRIVTQKLPHLSKPQATVLSLWSLGIALTQCCGLSTVSAFLAELLEQPENTVRQRLREWYQNLEQKRGRKRRELEVSASFVPLLTWILSWWSPSEKRLVLAADASNLGDRLTVLLIAVVYRGCGLPVAWKILPATTPGSWQPHWLKLLAHLERGVPDDWFVLLTTDRGLYAKWFYEAIQALNWHPFMRINHQGQYQVAGTSGFMPLSTAVSQVGQSWTGTVTCFKTNPLACTLLARWDEGYSDPWLVVTDLDPQQTDILWYGLRSWIECLFKHIKRGGFNWHLTRMRDPQRAERLWLAIAVATIWLVSVGGHADAQLSASSLPVPISSPNTPDSSEHPVPETDEATTLSQTSEASQTVAREAQPKRSLSCFRRGLVVILATLLKGLPLPVGQFLPEFASLVPESAPIFSSG
ncbi:MAG: transposase [Leptolyngbyaceae cyanobacterium]